MLFAGLTLARRLERAEGHACVPFAEARRRLFPASGAGWIEQAGAAALDLLCARGYRPIETSSVLYRPVEKPAAPGGALITVRVIGPGEAPRWAGVSARGWAHEHSLCLLAEFDGVPGVCKRRSSKRACAVPSSGAATSPRPAPSGACRPPR